MTEEMKDDISQPFIRLGNYITRLKQENEKLKEFKKIAIDNGNKVYNKMLDYRSALEDIKEIAERYKDMEGCRIPLRAIKMIVEEVLTP